jgi:muconolactone delta-isomerase
LRTRKQTLSAQDSRSLPVTKGLAEVQLKILALEVDAPGAEHGAGHQDGAGHEASAFTPALLQAEAHRAWELLQAGVIRELYFRTDRHAAVLVLECASTQEARDVLTTLPLVAAGLITFELIPLAPYPGFARLFAV